MGFKRKIQVLLATLICWPVAAQDYTPVPIPPQIIGSPQTMTPLNGGDDSTRLVQLAFPFEYFGQTFTQAWVSSNGFVSFNNVGHLCCDGWPIENAPRNTIYGLWGDLISGGNPYFSTSSTATIFGWYGTQEYGSGLSNTFEIALFPDGKVQWNYGDVNNVYHTVSAGLTGPTMADSISLFYGQNVNLLDNTSYVTGAAPPPPEPEPVFTPVAVVPTPGPSASPVQVMTAEEETQFEAAVDAVFEAIEAQAESTPAAEEQSAAEEAVQEIVQEAQTEEASESEASAEETQAEESSDESGSSGETTKSSSDQPAGSPPPPPGFNPTGGPVASSGSTQESEKVASSEVRRDRNVDFFQREAIEEADLFARETVLQATVQNVAFLAQADAQYAQQYGPQVTTETAGVTYSLQPTEGPTFSAVTTTFIGSDTTVSSPAGQAQQMELLNMAGMQGEMAAGTPTDVGDVNTGDGEAMAQLAAIPVGYSAYTQARIPDLPFYQPKDIYKGRRIPDQNMALYLMMRGQDSRWQEMVDEQYE